MGTDVTVTRVSNEKSPLNTNRIRFPRSLVGCMDGNAKAHSRTLQGPKECPLSTAILTRRQRHGQDGRSRCYRIRSFRE